MWTWQGMECVVRGTVAYGVRQKCGGGSAAVWDMRWDVEGVCSPFTSKATSPNTTTRPTKRCENVWEAFPHTAPSPTVSPPTRSMPARCEAPPHTLQRPPHFDGRPPLTLRPKSLPFLLTASGHCLQALTPPLASPLSPVPLCDVHTLNPSHTPNPPPRSHFCSWTV